MGKALLKVERLCALMDPRRKMFDAVQLANGSAALRTSAEADLIAVNAEYAADLQPSEPVPGTSGQRRARGTCCQEEEAAFETRGTARCTCGGRVAVAAAVRSRPRVRVGAC